MSKFKDLLAKKDVVVLDGALATQLEAMGLDISGKLWSAKHIAQNPDAIKQIHKNYLKAGSDIITTASYQATIPGLMAAGFSEKEAYGLIIKTSLIAREAVDEFIRESGATETPLVAASIGPYGAYLSDGSEYRGDYNLSKSEFKAFHEPRIRAILEGGADMLAVETIPLLSEAEAICELLEQNFKDVPCWISFTARDENELASGDAITDVVKILESTPNVLAYGFNCISDTLASALLANLKKAGGTQMRAPCMTPRLKNGAKSLMRAG
ncbi:homocysteine S-methyltransferase [Campylobacter californiensis]|uniref:homocysteine S-methyltransferase n=1 Tax=Campylobacter californiensis TaxID=1032243 RepID=UPI0014763DF8|nr:homocysteine S-methyltransferase [Campylobacter sp. RM12916]MBE3609203.1 homocysteine S-methyltransferase [Campylobacter sp. RM12916]